MSFGDLLEWLAAALLILSAYLWSGTVLALAVAAGCLIYLAQVYSGVSFRKNKRGDS